MKSTNNENARQIADSMESNSDLDVPIVIYCKLVIDAMGTFGAGGTPEEFDAFIAAETTKWAKVIKDAGVKAD